MKMADSGIFRVQIDLGNFFSDHKAKAYVSVDTQWKNVRQFHRHIGEIFDIKRFLLLTNDGVYLPAKENIGIIHSGDVIQVLPKSDDSESVISAMSETMATFIEQPKQNLTVGVSSEYTESVGTNDTSSTNGTKRKRVRHRKKKQNSNENIENQMNLPNVETPVSGILKSVAPLKPPKNIPKSNTHVSAQSVDSKNEINSENAGSNETIRKHMITSGHSDEYSIEERDSKKLTPKKEYTRSQLLQLGSVTHGQTLESYQTAQKLVDKEIMRKNPCLGLSSKASDLVQDKVETNESGGNFNDDFWSKVTTTECTSYANYISPVNIDAQITQAGTKLDDKYEVSFNTKAKVDNWLKSGQTPAYNSYDYSNVAIGGTPLSTKNEHINVENASVVSTKSAIRSKLLEKTARVKETLQKLANNANN